MRLLPTTVTALALLATPVAAQDADIADEGDAIEAMSEKLSDPAMQAKAAIMARGLMGMLLELPVGSLARAAAEIEGEDSEAIDPDMTLREFGGEGANDLPQDVQERVPQMMDRLAGMSGAFEAMVPALREMAGRLEEAVEAADYR